MGSTLQPAWPTTGPPPRVQGGGSGRRCRVGHPSSDIHRVRVGASVRIGTRRCGLEALRALWTASSQSAASHEAALRGISASAKLVRLPAFTDRVLQGRCRCHSRLHGSRPGWWAGRPNSQQRIQALAVYKKALSQWFISRPRARLRPQGHLPNVPWRPGAGVGQHPISVD